MVRSRPRTPDRARAGAGRRLLRASGRLLAATSRRARRVAGEAVSASVPMPDPAARPVPPRPRHVRVRPGRGGRFVRSGPGLPVLAIGLLMLLIVTMLGVERVTGLRVLPDRFIAGLRPPPAQFPVLPASHPVGIEIDEIDVAAPVHGVGIAADGSIAAPDAARAQEAGWYDQGPTPGQYGPAVIVGHVDTSTGPAVFHELPQLRGGDRVEVSRSDGSVAVFEVDRVDRFDKQRLPVDEVYGDFSRPQLRLITCGGAWVGGETGYADNVVVFASLVRAR